MPRMPLANGQTFAGYRILRLLGSGGMGEVYLAQHPRLPKKVALKVLSAEVSANADYRARFELEADLACKLDHPNIVVIHDRDEENGQLWISMNYVDGLDAARLLTEKFPSGMPPQQAAKIINDVASALDCAHGRGLLHRDVKPANIMITADEQRTLLTDFGIACSLKEIRSLTTKGFVVATVPYAAPEQLKGQKLDGRADQYALAKTAYELLTGSQLFPHSLAERPVGHVAFDAILATALASNPEDRFSTCTEFAQALTLAHRGAWAATPSGTLHPKQNGGNGSRESSDRATRPETSKGPPIPTTDDSVFIPSEVNDVGGSRPRWLITAAIVASLFLVAVAYVLWPAHPPDDRATKGTTVPPTAVAPSMTFESMRDFVEGYYADLPDNPNRAWAKTKTKNCTDCYQDYVNFWSKIRYVQVDSITPRDPTSVVARLTYTRLNGTTATEDRWLKMTLVDGKMLLDESGRIGAANEPTTAPPTSSSQPPPTANAQTIDQMLSNGSGAGERPIVSGLHNQGYGYLDYGLVSQAWDRTCWWFGGAHGASSIAVDAAKQDLIGMRFTSREADAIIGIAMKVHAQPGIESCP
jgi:serine/threonine protein kinase